MFSRLVSFILIVFAFSATVNGQSITYTQDTVILNSCLSPSIGQIPFYNNTGSDILLSWQVTNSSVSDSGFIALIIDPDQYPPFLQSGVYNLYSYDTSRVIAEFYMYNVSAGDSALYQVALYDPLDSLQTYKTLTFIWKCYVNNILSTDEKFTYTFYPNPVHDHIVFNIKSPFMNKFIFKLFDVTGKELLVKKYFNKNHFIIDASQLENGIYFFNIYSDQSIIIDKFIKNQ